MLALSRGGLKRHLTRFLETKRLYATQNLVKPVSDEYTEKPEYPEILSLMPEARRRRDQQSWHEEIKSVQTVEEKLIKINMPRYYGFKTVTWDSSHHPYNCLPVTQHYTRTVLESYDNLPSGAKDEATKSQISSLVTNVSDSIREVVEVSHEFFREKYGSNVDLSDQEKDKILGQILVENINRTLINTLSDNAEHLSEVEVDLNPRHEAFWAVGGVESPKVRKEEKDKYTAQEPQDRLVQYKGEPYLALRHKLPLAPIISLEDSTSPDKIKQIPLYKYDPRTLGYRTSFRHGTNIPGHWPGSPSSFGLIAYHPRDHLVVRNPTYEDNDEVLHVQAIQCSFGWLLAQANYHGFSTYNDITYPMTTQTIITNGKQWSFYRYQLNTTLIHSDHVHENPKTNYCWGTKELSLYQEVDSNGKCVGLNEDVVRHLVELYISAPVQSQTELQPYLSSETPTIADIADDDRREFLEKTFKHLVANIPRHLEIPEIYLWEKIYKIDNKTRPMEPKRRFFELGINPWKRTLDQHDKVYIPRAVRPGGPKSKPRFKKTYYP